MKKLLAIALIAASLTACNNEKKEETPVAPAVDSLTVKAADSLPKTEVMPAKTDSPAVSKPKGNN